MWGSHDSQESNYNVKDELAVWVRLRYTVSTFFFNLFIREILVTSGLNNFTPINIWSLSALYNQGWSWKWDRAVQLNDTRAGIYLCSTIVARFKNLGLYIVHLCNSEQTILEVRKFPCWFKNKSNQRQCSQLLTYLSRQNFFIYLSKPIWESCSKQDMYQ
jgi:hypothetical protein